MTIDSGSLLVLVQAILFAGIGGYVALSKFSGQGKIKNPKLIELD